MMDSLVEEVQAKPLQESEWRGCCDGISQFQGFPRGTNVQKTKEVEIVLRLVCVPMEAGFSSCPHTQAGMESLMEG